MAASSPLRAAGLDVPNMTRLMPHAVVGLVLAGLVLAGCTLQTSSLDSAVARFAEAKRAQAEALVMQQNLSMPSDGWRLFDAVRSDDFARATNLFARLERNRFAPTTGRTNIFQQALDWALDQLQKIGLYDTRTPVGQSAAWQPLAETYWAYVGAKTWQKPLLDQFCNDILAAVPTNSIYFGGTDPGRFAISARCESHAHGRPFFVLTQNQLADGTYLDYLHSMFSNHIYVPTPNDSQQVFQTYLTGAQRRLAAGQLKKGENVQTSGGRVSVSGQAAVMEINALLVKVIFDNNPNLEIFIEQSWPLDWTYPHLVPQGPIFKIHRDGLLRLSEEVVAADRAYWSQRCATLIGAWLEPGKTTVSNVCDFVERTCVNRDLHEFRGHPDYPRDAVAQEAFAKLRLGTADLYLWRCVKAEAEEEKQRMWSESLLAYQQSFALGPANAEVATDFAGALAQVNRTDEAIRILQLSVALNPTNTALQENLGKLCARNAK